MSGKGIIPFSRFMELALYCPVYGYYEKEGDNVGRRGDFCTSVSVGCLFGELLGCRFAPWLADCAEAPGPVQIVEGGAHDGTLARDILTWMRGSRPDLFDRLEYWIIEPSTRRREWQRHTLAEMGARLRQASDFGDLAAAFPRGVRGVVFANELLDALPVQRWGWDARQKSWFEWGVALHDGQFVWERIVAGRTGSPACRTDPSAEASAKAEASQRRLVPAAGRPDAAMVNHFQLPPELLAVLPDGFAVELCPMAATWWTKAAAVLTCGKLMTIDYGLEAEELFAPERKDGTLRAYRRHRLNGDILADPGSQDITAHVNFGAVRAAGEAAGLRTEVDQTQAQFLTGIVASIWNGELAYGEWTATRTRQFQTLTHPEHFGRPFRVLVQRRAAP